MGGQPVDADLLISHEARGFTMTIQSWALPNQACELGRKAVPLREKINILIVCIAFVISSHAALASDEQGEKLVSPEQIGKEIKLSGTFRPHGRYAPYIQAGKNDEPVYLYNTDPLSPIKQLREGDPVTVTAVLQLSPGLHWVKNGKRMKLVWTEGFKWTGKKYAAKPLEHYFFDARGMKIESNKSP